MQRRSISKEIGAHGPEQSDVREGRVEVDALHQLQE